MHAIVPVASCSRVWSTLRAIGLPGSSSPSTRCSFSIWRERFSGIGLILPGGAETTPYKLTHAREHAASDRERGAGVVVELRAHHQLVAQPLLERGADVHERP